MMDMMIQTDSLASEVHWPQVLTDAIHRQEGLVLFSGTRDAQVNLLETAVPPHSLKNGDVVISARSCTMSSTEEIINTAEEGRLVVQSVMAPSVISSIHKVFSHLNGNQHLIWRYVDQLVLVINQMKISDINSKDLFIHEVMLATPAVKKILLSSQIDELEGLLKENRENQGVVSFNQTLLQLLIRRRIDLKTAFLKTRDPENLDLLLKKVGI